MWALVARVLGERVEGGVGDREGSAGSPPSSSTASVAAALDRRVGAAGLVVERELVGLLAGGPGPLPGAAGEELGAGRHHPGAGRVGRGAAAPSARAARAGRRSRAALPGSPARWPGIRPRRSGTRRARRPGSRGRGWASPRSRRRARARARRRSRPGTRRRAAPGRRRPRRGSAPKGKRGACTPITLQAGLAVAARPLAQVGEGPHAVELGEVEEVDERRAARGQRGHRVRLRRRSRSSPVGQVGGGDVVASGAHAADVILGRACTEFGAFARCPLVPLLFLLRALLLGRYPGCEAIVRLSRADRRRAPAPARRAAPAPPQRARAPSPPGGGLLIAFGLAQRPPPLLA